MGPNPDMEAVKRIKIKKRLIIVPETSVKRIIKQVKKGRIINRQDKIYHS